MGEETQASRRSPIRGPYSKPIGAIRMSHKAAKRSRRESKELLNTFVSKAMSGLRKMAGVDLKNQQERFPNQRLPCDTCAFRSHTDSWKGMHKTVLSLLSALLHKQPFFCHVDPQTGKSFPAIDGESGVPQAITAGKPVDLCAAWSSICTRPQDEIIGVIADACGDEPVQRPINAELRAHILKITETFDGG